jgi:hypothetical protein
MYVGPLEKKFSQSTISVFLRKGILLLNSSTLGYIAWLMIAALQLLVA